MSTAIIYSFTSNKTAKAGQKIVDSFGESLKLDVVDADNLTEDKFLAYDQLILGVPTWFDGELPHYWDEFVPAMEEMDMKGKKVAIYGLADQVGYPENFADGVGILARLLRDRGAEIVGQTDIDNYTFESSHAIENGQFLGLVLDQENQARLSKKRIENWLEDLKNIFK
ncbi:flavodoxin [uncultured Sunxiuqinia sp.]|jgi:flavodoxin I|uniref:flavodoxin n=1 Tax=uncultured Sunxiuqinia sp. TaxID=1573825 RepID=UPI0030D8B8F3|tara:strand:- start:52644 stop:53150 length:507 start_codon:yes stop_codon:yes gene_type:complete